MKIKWSQVWSTALVFTIMLCGAAVVTARGFGPNHHGPFPNGDPRKDGPISLLGPIGHDLSDEQKTQIADIIREHYDDLTDTLNSLQEAQEGLSTAILAEEFNEVDFLDAVQKLSALRGELADLRARIIAQVRTTVLDSEQVERMQKREFERIEGMKDRTEFEISRLDEWLETNSE